MGRRNMGKTATIRQRTVNVYLPDMEMLERWKAEAERKNKSLSKFIIEKVEAGIKRVPSTTELEKLNRKISELEAEVERLNRRDESAQEQIGRLIKEIDLCRSQLNADSAFPKIDRRLIELLRSGPVREEEILKGMGVERGSKEAETVIAQLQLLLDFELVVYDGRYWRWCEGNP